MKHKFSKRILSTLLAIVMLFGILPTATIPVFAEEITYTKAGEIGAVTSLNGRRPFLCSVLAFKSLKRNLMIT